MLRPGSSAGGGAAFAGGGAGAGASVRSPASPRSVAPPSGPPVTIGNPARAITLDFDALRRVGLLPPEHQQRELSHQYRTLKRPLIKHIQDVVAGAATATGSPRSVMVTSALPGEGKTFTSMNLAMSLALEKDYSVILVDGDAPKPHISHTLGLGSEAGLFDVLSDPSRPIESVVLPTSIKGLSVLPVGHRSDTATELLASARTRQVIAELEALDPRVIVLVDSPPILLTSEARVLASLFGQVLLVVSAGRTPQQAVAHSLEIIGEGPRVGLVLNQAIHDTETGGYYGYGYGYGYEDQGPK
jgi:receptor protein-tyrosine kinase